MFNNNELINVLLRHGFIFGGFLRDFFAGEQPKDIDVALSSKYAQTMDYGLLCLDLIKLGSVEEYEIKGSRGRYSYGPDSYEVRKLRLTTKTDTYLICKHHVDESRIREQLDFSVNALTLTNNGIGHLKDNHKVLETIEHIRKRVAKREFPVGSFHKFEHRIAKMREKGYDLIDVTE